MMEQVLPRQETSTSDCRGQKASSRSPSCRAVAVREDQQPLLRTACIAGFEPWDPATLTIFIYSEKSTVVDELQQIPGAVSSIF